MEGGRLATAKLPECRFTAASRLAAAFHPRSFCLLSRFLTPTITSEVSLHLLPAPKLLKNYSHSFPKNSTNKDKMPGAVEHSTYADVERRIHQIMNRLRALGAEATVPIPVIAIVGSQSAGKSSIVNAISGVQFPRASGTCTRCPMECRMISEEGAFDWTCQIKLRYEIEIAGSAERQIREVDFGDVIYEKDDVEVALRCAQLAVLNPDRWHFDFVGFNLTAYDEAISSGSSDGKVHPTQLSFTTNVVCLEIRSATSLNLTFIDLPGIIQTAREGEDADSPEVIKSLVLKYIKQESTIILIAVSMETEFENQIAPKLAREYDPSGLRTIGVLTKPDIARESTSKAFIPIIRNEKERLMHSWFVVKSPEIKDGENPPDAETAKAQEAAWFSNMNSHPAWKGIDPTLSRQFGIPNLTVKLSQILNELNQKSLPGIHATITSKLEETIRSLRTLPEASTEEPSRIVLKLISTYATEIKESLKGDPADGKDGFIQMYNTLCNRFVKELRVNAPRFRPFTKSKIEKGPTSEEIQTFNKTRTSGSVATELLTAENLYTKLSDEEPDFLVDRCHFQPEKAKFSDNDEHLLMLDLTDIEKLEIEFVFQCMLRGLSRRSRTTELPGNVPFALKRELIKRSVQPFKGHAFALFDEASKLLKTTVLQHADRIFSNYTVGGLKERVRQSLLRMVSDLKQECIAYLETRLSVECVVYTNNSHYLSDYKTKFLKHYRSLSCPPTDTYLSENDRARLVATAAQLGFTGRFEELKMILAGHGKKSHDDELEIMAEVRAYWQVAFKRFIDDVPVHILFFVVYKFVDNVQNQLLDSIATTGPDSAKECGRLVREAEDVVYQRTTLIDRKKKLEEAAAELAGF